MNLTRLQIIESICDNGYKETLNTIIKIPQKIDTECASTFLTSCYYLEIARMVKFVIKEDGTAIKVR